MAKGSQGLALWVWDIFFDGEGAGGFGEFLAVGIEEVAFDQAAEGEDVFSAGAEPTHARELGALSHDMAAGAFDGPEPMKNP